VTITESSSRDGLQSLGAFVPTAAKSGLINDLSRTGLRLFDAVSFVSPKAVPQMADGAEVLAGVERVEGMALFGLVPNLKGLETAVAAGVDGIGVLTAASDTFNERNINATVDESMHRIRRILLEVPEDLVVRGYVSTATHCPFEGEQDPDWVAHLAETLVEWVHFHDTYGQAVANTAAALGRGVAMMDASAGGLGGCPYAPGATGNVATEDVLYLLDGLGIEHGIDAIAVAEVAQAFCADHNLSYNSAAGRALLASRARE
jgi:hydroxymethylglutaryl-CoA lyase